MRKVVVVLLLLAMVTVFGIKIRLVNTAGADFFYKEIVLEEFKKAHPEIEVIYGTSDDSTFYSKLRAEKEAGLFDKNEVDVELLIMGNGPIWGYLLQENLLLPIIPHYLSYMPNVRHLTDLAWQAAVIGEGFGVPTLVEAAGPILVYNSEFVKNPPKTVEELKDWISKHPNRFIYGSPRSGAGKLWLWGVPPLVGDVSEYSDLDNPKEFRKTWEFLQEIEPYVQSHPSATGDMIRMFAQGQIWIFPMYNIWFQLLRMNGDIPPDTSVGYFLEGTKPIISAHFAAIPKGNTPEEIKAALTFIDFMTSPEIQVRKLAYLAPPLNELVNIGKAPEELREVYEKWALPELRQDYVFEHFKVILPPPPEVDLKLAETWGEIIGKGKW